MTPASARFDNFRDLNGHKWPWPHFKPHELADSRTGELLIVPTFLDWLEGVRTIYDQPMIVTSGYRTPEHQQELSGRRTGAHVDGMAVDVLVWGASAHALLKVAMAHGAYGVGINQKGDHDQRYIHIDRWSKAPKGARPMVWSY